MVCWVKRVLGVNSAERINVYVRAQSNTSTIKSKRCAVSFLESQVPLSSKFEDASMKVWYSNIAPSPSTCCKWKHLKRDHFSAIFIPAQLLRLATFPAIVTAGCLIVIVLSGRS